MDPHICQNDSRICNKSRSYELCNVYRIITAQNITNNLCIVLYIIFTHKKFMYRVKGFKYLLNGTLKVPFHSVRLSGKLLQILMPVRNILL